MDSVFPTYATFRGGDIRRSYCAEAPSFATLTPLQTVAEILYGAAFLTAQQQVNPRQFEVQT